MKQDGKFFYGWWVVLGGVLIIMFAIPLVNTLGSLFLVPITEEMGISRSQFVLTGTIVSVMTIVMSPIAGKLYASKKFKMRTIQTAALIVLALAYGSYVFATNPIMLYVSAFFMGVGFIAAGMMPTSIMINNWFVKKRGFAMSLALMGISLGAMVMAPPMTQLILNYGWRTARLAAMVAMLIVCIPISMLVMKEKPEDIGLRPYGAGEAAEQSKSKSKTKAPSAVTVENNIPLRYAKKFGFFYVLMIGMLFSGILTGGVVQHYNPFFTDNHGAVTAAWLVSFGSFMGIIGKLLVGIIFDKLGNRKSMLIGTICGTGVFLGYSFFGSNLHVMVVLSFFDGIGSSIASLGFNLLIPAIFGTINYSEVFGFLKGWQQAGMAAGALIIAFIFDMLGSYFYAWIFAAVLMFLSGMSIIYADCQANKLNGRIGAMIAADEKDTEMPAAAEA